MEKSSRSALALAGAVNQVCWAPVWNAFAPAEVKTWSSPSKVWLFEGTWLYSLAISKIIVSVAVFGFPWGRVCFHRRPCSRHRSFLGTQSFFQRPFRAAVQCHMFSCSTLLLSFVPCSSSQHFPSGSFSPRTRLCRESPRNQHWERQPGAGKSCCSQGWAVWSIHFQAVDSSHVQEQLPAAGIIPGLCWLRAAHQELRWKRGIHSLSKGWVWGCGISLQGFYLPSPARVNTRSPWEGAWGGSGCNHNHVQGAVSSGKRWQQIAAWGGKGQHCHCGHKNGVWGAGINEESK